MFIQYYYPLPRPSQKFHRTSPSNGSKSARLVPPSYVTSFISEMTSSIELPVLAPMCRYLAPGTPHSIAKTVGSESAIHLIRLMNECVSKTQRLKFQKERETECEIGSKK